MLFIFLAALPKLFIYAFIGHQKHEENTSGSDAITKLRLDNIAAVGTGDVVVNMCTGPFIYAICRAV